MYNAVQPKKRGARHPYLCGNFAPVATNYAPTSISYSGTIPSELLGGQYVRNSSNPLSNSDLGRAAHWFDGDGMLTGVHVEKSQTTPHAATPRFMSQHILTDVALSSLETPQLRTPILPSIATLSNPASSLLLLLWTILRTVFIVILSHLPGSQRVIKRISVANTSFLFHDGRALATCESGPPMRVQLPNLETVGWYDGISVEGEVPLAGGLAEMEKAQNAFGGTGLTSWMREWTTGHPKVDPRTGEMMLFHCNFLPPFVHYSLIPPEPTLPLPLDNQQKKLVNVPVPGCSGGKMMHDFGVSLAHTVILDLPLSLTAFNLLKNEPMVSYQPHKPSRFGIFPRRDAGAIRWFETASCCIFHTANTWDDIDSNGHTTAVNLLACRMTSANMVFSAGNIQPLTHPNRKKSANRKPMSFFAKYDEDDEVKDLEKDSLDEETPLLSTTDTLATNFTPSSSRPPVPLILDNDEEQCRLYYYRFALASATENTITHQYALSAIPFEFPTLAPKYEMSCARYIYGCSTTSENFGAALGKATKVDIVVKMDVDELLARGEANPPKSIIGCIDNRSIAEVLQSKDKHDPISVFQLPPLHYAQEARFVPRSDTRTEDDGFLLFYVFDESQLDDDGECRDDATSELWVLNAKDMKTIVCKFHLPARVPYGLHGNWFSEAQIKSQRGIVSVRQRPQELKDTWWLRRKAALIRALG
ncbi:carotenoid oxygenase [Massariosphaeria phaeospora]|uniref:Carotenoid oxygenase n=1 Tax=Massariosphaeria phaeospora TaxID=100035 RepID=A0A7C8MJG0_9PLEO|nr:carotenoid oxygenase [Massariosphaeria phaeospora]